MCIVEDAEIERKRKSESMVNLQSLAERWAIRKAIPIKKAKRDIEEMSIMLLETLALEQGIRAVGKFSLKVVDVKEKKGKHWKTGEEWVSPAHKTLKLKVSKKLEQKIEEMVK